MQVTTLLNTIDILFVAPILCNWQDQELNWMYKKERERCRPSSRANPSVVRAGITSPPPQFTSCFAKVKRLADVADIRPDRTIHIPSGGSRGRPPTAQNVLNLMQFLEKIGKIVCWCHPSTGNPGWRRGHHRQFYQTFQESMNLRNVWSLRRETSPCPWDNLHL